MIKVFPEAKNSALGHPNDSSASGSSRKDCWPLRRVSARETSRSYWSSKPEGPRQRCRRRRWVMSHGTRVSAVPPLPVAGHRLDLGRRASQSRLGASASSSSQSVPPHPVHKFVHNLVRDDVCPEPDGRPSDLPLFRPDISQVGADRASVMRCRRSLLLAVGRCCCCHRCCQLGAGRPVASRPARCRGWPASGPGRLPPGPWFLTGVSAEAPGSSVTSRVRSPGTFHLCSLPCGHSHA